MGQIGDGGGKSGPITPRTSARFDANFILFNDLTKIRSKIQISVKIGFFSDRFCQTARITIIRTAVDKIGFTVVRVVLSVSLHSPHFPHSASSWASIFMMNQGWGMKMFWRRVEDGDCEKTLQLLKSSLNFSVKYNRGYNRGYLYIYINTHCEGLVCQCIYLNKLVYTCRIRAKTAFSYNSI